MNLFNRINELKAKYSKNPDTRECYQEIMQAWQETTQQLVDAAKVKK